ncbi:unnamed protein product [Plutella xylostella]|uniref:(diamondback moth) hypothetical protein n=1 Tax=Plutella xylostella TaxID=51655 RepID=A0A8S4FJM3_PLUXY|nr:unnamed protein product [Plutella xylostella]
MIIICNFSYISECGKLPDECKHTARLLRLFDDLFDSINGSYHQVMNGKVYRAAVTPKSPHHAFWRRSLKVLKSMKFCDKAGRTVSVPSVQSCIKSRERIEKLFQLLKSMGIDSILLRNLNQDPLENFFGAIRSHGQSNTMPNAFAFEAAYKLLLINNLSSAHSVGANCESDGVQCLQSLKYLIEKLNNKNTCQH